MDTLVREEKQTAGSTPMLARDLAVDMPEGNMFTVEGGYDDAVQTWRYPVSSSGSNTPSFTGTFTYTWAPQASVSGTDWDTD